MEISMEPDPHSATILCNKCDHSFEHNHYPLESTLSALRLNYSPEGYEAHGLLRTVDAINSQFDRYDPEISRVQDILASLRDRRRRLKWYQECCSSLLSPIRKLPPEILQNIFLAGRGTESDIIPVEGQVCRYWRDLVLGTGKLWSIISIGRTRFSFVQNYHDLASLFLERSANHPLSISIRNPADTRLVKLLAGHTQRWRTLLVSPRDHTFFETTGLFLLDLQSLERLEIADPLERVNHLITLSVQNAPQLRDVVLKSPLACWSLPWTQLTRLQYDVSAARDGIQVLHLCPQLVECSLDTLTEAAAADLPPIQPSVRLRSLRLAVDTGAVTQSAEAIMHSFFIRLTTPSLVSLEIIGQFTPSDLTEFVARSECALENLTLGTGYMKDEIIILVLENLPLLRTLVLDADIGTTRQLQNRVISDKLLRRFIFFPDSDCLLPCLTHLTLTTALNFQDQVLLDLIESRWIPWVTELYGVPVSRLTSVDLHFFGNKKRLSASTIEQLRDLFAAGLRISLQHEPTRISLESAGS